MNSTCSFPGCDKPIKSRKDMLCGSHYAQKRRGKPLAPLRKPIYVCTVEGCDNPHSYGGHCKGHANRLERTGDVQAHIPLATKRPGAVCDIDGCGQPHYANGYCAGHKSRVSRLGDPMADKPLQARYTDPEEAFAARTQPDGDCLVWTGPLEHNGYGTIQRNGIRIKSHRYAWERANGPIPRGMYVDHICWNRACVKAEHLRLATPAQNSANLSTTGRASEATPVRNVRRSGDRWEVRVGAGGDHVGYFDTFEEAQQAAEQARIDRFGDYAGR